ncbi:unnamed protein product [Candidula unifasciata]|uniref:G-protein coupled receptors family 1 profile domain-containing protein n=1 Tax=Candidula unifasciata TaxID=100452 RepID=A0A8S3YT92_9EUPU|nr:unnamed protein product [Candidula unifasciata]
MKLFKDADNNSETSNGFLSVLWTIHVPEIHLQIVSFFNLIVLSGLISVLGTVANVINLIVFYRQGLNTNINISFFALTLSDLSCLILQQWHIVIEFFKYTNLPIVFTDFQHATAAWPHELLTRLTCAITLYITVERCLCVMLPFAISKIFTVKRTLVVIICIYGVHFASWIPAYTSCYIGWKFFPERNQTLLGLIFVATEQTIAIFYIANAFSGVFVITCIVLVTLILKWQLRIKSDWRNSANAEQKKAEMLSKRERKTVVMVILIAVILVVCYTPSVTLSLITFCVPGFNVGGKYFEIYQFVWSFAYVLENINSSGNIFLYFKMGSKYRSTFKRLFRNED